MCPWKYKCFVGISKDEPILFENKIRYNNDLLFCRTNKTNSLRWQNVWLNERNTTNKAMFVVLTQHFFFKAQIQYRIFKVVPNPWHLQEANHPAWHQATSCTKYGSCRHAVIQVSYPLLQRVLQLHDLINRLILSVNTLSLLTPCLSTSGST